MKLLFSDITALLCGEEPIKKHVYVGVEDGKILFAESNPPENFHPNRFFKGKDKVLLPGLINAHAHLPMSLFRGFADDMKLQEWLFDHILPAEDRLNGYMAGCGALLSIAEGIAAGVTSVSDMYFFSEDVAKAAYESGVKANISRCLTGYKEGEDKESSVQWAQQEALYRDWHGADSGRIKVDTALHAEYTTNERLWHDVAQYAREKKSIIHLHLSETAYEHEQCITKYKMTPAEVFYKAGIFESRVLAAHCVHITENDMDIMAEAGAVAAHNPQSNLKLSSGVAPVARMLEKGVVVALGTDGAASNNSQSVLAEMKAAALLAKGVSGEPTLLPAETVLKMAVQGGAYAQKREKECGTIAPGMDADLVMLDFTKPGLFPCHNALSSTVYSACGSDVELTMVRGRILYEKGEFTTIDMEKLRYEIEEKCMPALRNPDK